MQVKIFLYTLVAVILASFLPAEAQQDKVYRVGILTSPGKAEERGQIKGLRDGLREAGYIEGKNLRLTAVECRDRAVTIQVHAADRTDDSAECLSQS